jgi:hypothetical protein
MIPAFAAPLLRRGKRLRSFRFRTSTFALRASADKSRYGGQVRQVFAIAMAVVFFGSSSVFACPVCFGAEETSMIDASRLGILVLLFVTFAVQGAFVGFFLYLRKRAKLIADIDLDNEWSELQGGATRT